jgi:hypothetical protein
MVQGYACTQGLRKGFLDGGDNCYCCGALYARSSLQGQSWPARFVAEEFSAPC